MLRQPRPPPRHRRSDGSLMVGMMDPHLNIEGNTELAGGNRLSVNRSTRTYYFRRCKRKRLTNIESLPDDLVFYILLYLPAQDIYNSARLVCWKWYHMIHSHDFIYAHLQHTTYGLLIRDEWSHPPTFMALRQGRIEMFKFNNKFFKDVWPVWGSCNGLILEFDGTNLNALHIRNPATNQRLALPLFSRGRLFHLCSGIAYAAASMKYKVVATYPSEEGNPWVYRCAILTVGVDKSWRHVHTQHLSLTAKKGLCRIPLITEGYMHWIETGIHVLTLNVETELITETPIPQVYGEKTGMYHHLPTGKYLSLLIGRSKFSWEVWELKPETGEWTKLPNIDLEAQKCTFKGFEERFGYGNYRTVIPVGWLKYKEVLVFSIFSGTRACIVYNVHTQEINLFELASGFETFRFISHRNSLVWVDAEFTV